MANTEKMPSFKLFKKSIKKTGGVYNDAENEIFNNNISMFTNITSILLCADCQECAPGGQGLCRDKPGENT